MLKSSQKDFIKRHIGPSEADQQKMLNELGFNNLDENEWFLRVKRIYRYTIENFWVENEHLPAYLLYKMSL